jgi:hypothetical protein
MAERTFPDLESCALAGYSPAASARVVASAEVDDFALALVVTPDGGGDEYLVSCTRDAEGWHDAGGGSGMEQWGLTDEDDYLGWLGGWGREAVGVRAVRVEFAGKSTEVRVGVDGYFVWLLTGVPCPDGRWKLKVGRRHADT